MKFTKDGNVKYQDNKEVIKVLEADGWKQEKAEKPKAKKAPKKKSVLASIIKKIK